jgi:hypothetical protein
VGRFPRASGWMKAAVPCEERFKYRNKVNSQNFGMPALSAQGTRACTFLLADFAAILQFVQMHPIYQAGSTLLKIRRKMYLKKFISQAGKDMTDLGEWKRFPTSSDPLHNKIDREAKQ